MTAIAILRRKAGGVKTGHAGTLDPLATGVLVAAVGRATKSISRVMDTTKRYRTRIDLGAFTETDDREADRVEVATDDPPDLERIEGALEG
ncbi:MAG: tRNA pseudouridine(55) synthase TruB, partial [Planctomycetota bacterium]|nr:tRNA pseudouridine(55) synthase TruB [Planctomycetota bacterium]